MLSNAVASLLSEARLRPTISRIQVLQLFVDKPELRASIDQVYSELETQGTPLGITNVYRIVKALQEHGLLDRDWVQGRTSPVSVYALRCEQPDERPHRWVCSLCARRADFNDPALQQALERSAAAQGFELDPATAMTFQAVCVECAGKVKGR